MTTPWGHSRRFGYVHFRGHCVREFLRQGRVPQTDQPSFRHSFRIAQYAGRQSVPGIDRAFVESLPEAAVSAGLTLVPFLPRCSLVVASPRSLCAPRPNPTLASISGSRGENTKHRNEEWA